MGFLMISSVATLTWGRLRPRRSMRLEVIAAFGLTGAALLTEPWLTLIGICAVYLLLIPLGIVLYARVKQRAVLAAKSSAPSA
jgi:CDP-diacylglycerol--serine O-phosphatidyltransferase